MKILLVIPTVFGGGAEQVAATLSRQWSRQHDVQVLCWASEVPGQCFDFGVPVQYAGLGVQRGFLARVWNVWRRVLLLWHAVRRERPGVVLAFMDEAGMPCVMAGALGGWLDRLVVSVHHNPQWMPRWRRWLLGAFYQFPARIVAVSDGVRRELARSCGLSLVRVKHIPNPLPDLPLEVLPGEDDLLASFGSDYLLAVGRLDVQTKGFDLLLAAYAALPAGRPKLLILGEGAGRAWIEAEIARLGLQQEVMLYGWVRDPRLFYRRARAFVLASRYEGWSNVLMEAMGQACPVVATRCPYGPPEILGEALAHCLVAPDDAAALQAGIEALLKLDEGARRLLGEALRERVQHFAADGVAEAWMTLAVQLQECAR